MSTFAVHPSVWANHFVDIVKVVKPAVVGVGTHAPISSPPSQLTGTGFLIGDGRYVVTNHHVVAEPLTLGSSQKRVVFIGSGERPELVEVTIAAFDVSHDLAILELQSELKTKVSGLTIASQEWVDDGSEIGFTGFPIGAVLGLYPVTHRGIISSRSPVVIPAANSGQLSLALLKRLKDPFFTYQLDATAYPGNSGSPVYMRDTGEVVAIINKVFVKTTKEAVLSDPSGITYAIPVKYLHQLLSRSNIEL